MSQLAAASMWALFNNLAVYLAAITFGVSMALFRAFVLASLVGACMARLHLSAVR